MGQCIKIGCISSFEYHISAVNLRYFWQRRAFHSTVYDRLYDLFCLKLQTLYVACRIYTRTREKKTENERKRGNRTATKINKSNCVQFLCLSLNKSGFFDVICNDRTAKYIFTEKNTRTHNTDATIICLSSPASLHRTQTAWRNTRRNGVVNFKTLLLRSLTKRMQFSPHL